MRVHGEDCVTVAVLSHRMPRQ